MGCFEMVEVKKELLAPCGLYCGVCRIYKAHKDNDMEFKREILHTLNSYGAKTVNDIACTGCLSNDVVFPFCRTCSVKDCIKNKEIEGCYQCDEFPCKIITTWPDPLDKKSCFALSLLGVTLELKNGLTQRRKDIDAPNVGTGYFMGRRNVRNVIIM